MEPKSMQYMVVRGVIESSREPNVTQYQTWFPVADTTTEKAGWTHRENVRIDAINHATAVWRERTEVHRVGSGFFDVHEVVISIYPDGDTVIEESYEMFTIGASFMGHKLPALMPAQR